MKNTFRVLLVEDMESFRGAVSQLLGVYNDITEAESLETARAILQRETFDVVVLDKGLPDGDGIDLLTEIKASHPNTVVIVLTSDSDFSAVKHCIARGADDYVVKSENVIPDLLVRIPVAVSKAASSRKLTNLEQLVKDAFRYEIVGKSPSTMELRETVLSLKRSNAHVLITGESGTGKELIARRLNCVEEDRNRPFVAVNCGAIPENLIESELFGHKKGSFTGAHQDRVGKFEMAHNGDLFLDEIGELPLTAQIHLLRVIQEGEVTRVGDHRVIKVNCRIIAATNRDLNSMVQSGKFREDLYHRLNVIRIKTAPLRERAIDISDLAKLFTLQIGGPNFRIVETAIRLLRDYSWPGNIRELRNTIERALISARRRKSFEVIANDIRIDLPTQNTTRKARMFEASLPESLADLTPENYKDFMSMMDREFLRSALHLTKGNAVDLGRRIGLARSTIFKRLKELNVVDETANHTKSPERMDLQ